MKGFIDRRQFLGSAAVVALAGAGLPTQRAAARDGFSGYDGIGQAQLVHSKQATALELVESAIARIEAANPRLNAVDRIKEAVPLRERLKTFWREHPLPPLTGGKADKAFYDELSGDL